MIYSKLIHFHHKQFIFLVLLLLPAIFIKSQVTIGSLQKPNDGALLDLKNLETTNPISTTDISNITSTTGGLAIPRVSLVDKTTLEPFILIGDDDWTNASATKIKERHIGLMVYNMYISPDVETDPTKIFRKGLYVWKGQKWEFAFQGQKFFPSPPFNLPLPAVSETGDPDLTYNIYDEYAHQFTRTGNNHFTSNNLTLETISNKNNNKLYDKNELDYVVTHYDESVLIINSISTDGVMSYRVKSVAPEPTAFINILFVIKD